MRNIGYFARLALGVLLVTGSASVAGADIRVIDSSLRASAGAMVDPHTVEQTDSASDIPDIGIFRDMSADATAVDSSPEIESAATASGSVALTAADAFTVHLVATRSGKDTGVDEPGGDYSALATFELSFLTEADGVVTVDYGFTFARPHTGTFTPLALILESGNIQDSRGPRVAFGDRSGTVDGSEQFAVGANRAYTLHIQAFLSGATSNLTEEDSWDATFNVQIPPIVTDTSPTSTTSSTSTSSTVISSTSSTSTIVSTSTTSTVAAIATTTTLPPTCADLAPVACTSPSLPQSIARHLKRGCSLLARADAVNPVRASRLHRRAATKLSATCRAVSSALEKARISVECADEVRGTLGEFCG